MPRKKQANPKPAHRPQIPIDWEQVDKYLMCACTGTEVAAVLGMHPDTFYIRVEQEKGMGFSEYAAIKRAAGDNMLRAKQQQVAMQGNTTMLVWLGKNRLDQEDQKQSKEPIKIVVMRAEQDTPA